MNTSYPIQDNTTVSFRCPKRFKELINSKARSHNLSNSEYIRCGVGLMTHILNNPDIYKEAGGWLRELIDAIISVASSDAKQVQDGAIPDLLATIERLDLRNIAVLNRDEHDFNGCRVTITRHKHPFERYFSAKEYGGMKAALNAAITVRDYVLEQLQLAPDEMERIAERARTIAPPPYPRRTSRIPRLPLTISYTNTSQTPVGD